jgi:hypothetical protein
MKEHRQNGSMQGSLAGGRMAAPGKRSLVEVAQQGRHHMGAIPGVMAFPHRSFGPSASGRAFGTPPLTTDNDMQSLGDRMEAERLLSSKNVTSGQEAVRALEILFGQPTLVDKGLRIVLSIESHSEMDRQGSTGIGPV